MADRSWSTGNSNLNGISATGTLIVATVSSLSSVLRRLKRIRSGASDGLIRVEYKSEVVQQVVDQTIIRKHDYDDYFPVPRPYPWPYPRPYPRPWEPWCGDTTWTTGGTSQTVTTSSVNTANSNSTSSLRRSGISGSSAGMRTSRTPTRSLRSSASARTSARQDGSQHGNERRWDHSSRQREQSKIRDRRVVQDGSNFSYHRPPASRDGGRKSCENSRYGEE